MSYKTCLGKTFLVVIIKKVFRAGGEILTGGDFY